MLYLVYFPIQTDTGFIGPASCNILDCIAASSKNYHRGVFRLHEFDAFSVASNGKIETSQLVER
jgi:hypothetical protein